MRRAFITKASKIAVKRTPQEHNLGKSSLFTTRKSGVFAGAAALALFIFSTLLCFFVCFSFFKVCHHQTDLFLGCASRVDNSVIFAGAKHENTVAQFKQNVEVLSLVGTKYANIVRPTLTSLEIDMAEVGRRAMYMLIDLIDGSLFEKSYRFDARLQLRASTRR